MKTFLVLAFTCLISALPDPNPGLVSGAVAGVLGAGIYQTGRKVFTDDEHRYPTHVVINKSAATTNDDIYSNKDKDRCEDLKDENESLKVKIRRIEKLLDRYMDRGNDSPIVGEYNNYGRNLRDQRDH
ncbi:hypothetical protein ROZALSC1DRAFT_23837 [Rozella allomycis CSF55]|uniref:Uncharacterized protein n=1 Tax=Rozella allomycis (strain CSF55) TaxID=988480 RepID=A0A4P9YF89_ROZAC|nr:hypothetical protein ROZALSC1DRAFT_23837 [Rozella allomycis CSF55]